MSRGLNKSQCIDCLPKKWPYCGEVAVRGGLTVIRSFFCHSGLRQSNFVLLVTCPFGVCDICIFGALPAIYCNNAFNLFVLYDYTYMPIFFSAQTPRYAADEIAVFNPDTNEWQRKKVEVQ